MRFPEIPIWQAPTGSTAGPDLCQAVAEAGGCGAMGLTWTDPETARAWVNHVRQATDKPFLVNFALRFPPHALEAVLEAGAPCISFSWGDASPYIGKVREAGAGLGIQVVSEAGTEQALHLQPDFLLCQGLEAGGHVQSSMPLLELLPRVLKVANGIPVIAAGGIADAAGIREVLDMGATGTMLGSRFVATQESRAHEQYKQLLIERQETSLTVCFDGDWPYAPHRVIRNSTLEAWEAAGSPSGKERPGDGDILAQTATGVSIPRYDESSPQVGMTGDIEAMCLYAGAGIARIQDLPKARELVQRLWAEVKSL